MMDWLLAHAPEWVQIVKLKHLFPGPVCADLNGKIGTDN